MDAVAERLEPGGASSKNPRGVFWEMKFDSEGELQRYTGAGNRLIWVGGIRNIGGSGEAIGQNGNHNVQYEV